MANERFKGLETITGLIERPIRLSATRYSQDNHAQHEGKSEILPFRGDFLIIFEFPRSLVLYTLTSSLRE